MALRTGVPRIAYVMPTHDRAAVLDATLRRLASLPAHDAEVVIVDNASEKRVAALLRDGLGGVERGELRMCGDGGSAHSGASGGSIPVHVVRSEENLGAAGRNLGVEASDSSCGWVVMLDDDSWPEAEWAEAGRGGREGGARFGLLEALARWDGDATVGAVAGEIALARGGREAGGLPEVVIGCGCAIRRDVFVSLGGYDAAFGYYAEEYDLCARLIASGLRTVTDRRARFTHAKTPAGRDMDVILARLVRNNGWVMQRHAPASVRTAQVRAVVKRYGRIARKEGAERGWREGRNELMRTLRGQRRTPLDARGWDRFIGKAAARRGLLAAWAERPFSSARLVREGKGTDVVRELLEEMGVRVLEGVPGEPAEALVVGTLSPGPMWDGVAAERVANPQARVLPPWRADAEDEQARVGSTVTSIAAA
ncbi:MAG: glycosyltransferase [Phycisphaeraceae bacterium]|nr:glycosyltransferase [Phycisphaeraceae bacterium]